MRAEEKTIKKGDAMIFTNHRMIVLFQLMCSLVGCHPYTSFSQYAQWFEKLERIVTTIVMIFPLLGPKEIF